MKYCIVTGGAGYVGAHCCKELAAVGYFPVVVDNLSRGHKQFAKWGAFREGDLRDHAFLDAVFKEFLPEAVFHFAGYTYVGESVEKPLLYYNNNVVATISLLDAMRENACNNIIFSSTAATYGNPQYTPIDEKHPQEPINPYGQSKLFIEKILEDYDRAYGIKYCALRYFNASGADEDGEIGEEHDPETHLIPLVIQAALGKRKNVKIFGEDYPTPDGTAVRDYVHVTDLATAHIKAFERLAHTGESISLNLGTGKGTSVLEIIESVRRVSGRPVEAVMAERRAGDPPVLVADSSAAGKILDWKCRYNDVDAIVKTAWNWHSKNL